MNISVFSLKKVHPEMFVLFSGDWTCQILEDTQGQTGGKLVLRKSHCFNLQHKMIITLEEVAHGFHVLVEQ